MLKYETKVIKVDLKYFNYMLSYLLCILVMKGKVILGSTLNLKYKKELEIIVKPKVFMSLLIIQFAWFYNSLLFEIYSESLPLLSNTLVT